MQLYEELPSLVAMFLGGFFGLVAVEWLKRCATASARHRPKLEGLCQTTNPSSLAAWEETLKQQNYGQPNPGTERLRKRKAARKACKEIHPAATHGNQSVAYGVIMNKSGESTQAVKTVPPAGTSVDKPVPLAMVAESAAGSVQDHGDVPADDGCASGWECMTANIKDAEADDEADAEAALAANIQETGAGDHKQLQTWFADAERVCHQAVLNLEQKMYIQDLGTEASQQLKVHGTSEVGQRVEEQAAPADDEQCCFREPELGEWPETTDDEHFSQSQLDDGSLSREEEWRRVLIGDWVDATDEEDGSCLRVLDSSASQHETVEHDVWSMPFANDPTPTPQSVNSWSSKGKQGSRLDKDNWMTSFASADGEMSGWSTNDKWFGQGQRGNHWQQVDDDCDSGWFSEKRWFKDQRSKRSQSENDCWMTPFDELFQRRTPRVIDATEGSITSSVSSPIGPAVCIWNAGSPASQACGDSSNGNEAVEIFTDGQRIFQPVPWVNGQPLFTDGKQLYASVCTVVGPPGGEAVDRILATACTGAAMRGLGPANPSSSFCSSVSEVADWSDNHEPSCAPVGGDKD